MATRGIRGQNVANQLSAVALFGGFDDHIVRADLATGRITDIVSVGRTLLFPWDEAHFVCIEDALGRPSKVKLTLRSYGEPNEAVSADGEWSTVRRLIPGHYPTLFALQDGHLETIDVLQLDDPHATVAFIPGVYDMEVPVAVDGTWSDGGGTTIGGPGVGWGQQVYFATPEAIVAVKAGAITSQKVDVPWRPSQIELDPLAGRVLVASWNRWGSLGGPSSDIYVFDENGRAVASGHIKSLVARMALAEDGVMVMDIEDQPQIVELS